MEEPVAQSSHPIKPYQNHKTMTKLKKKTTVTKLQQLKQHNFGTKKQTQRSMKQDRKFRNKPMDLQSTDLKSIHDKGGKKMQWRKDSLH